VQWAAFVQIAPAIPCFTYASDRAMGCFCADSAQRIRVVKTIGPMKSSRDQDTFFRMPGAFSILRLALPLVSRWDHLGSALATPVRLSKGVAFYNTM